MDSLGNHFQEIKTKTNCFPGYNEFGNDINKFEVSVYDRSGKLLYNSTNKDENWICQDHIDSTLIAGAYFYQLIYSTINEPNKTDTLNGQIRIIENKPRNIKGKTWFLFH